jgi:hypothetical protein
MSKMTDVVQNCVVSLRSPCLVPTAWKIKITGNNFDNNVFKKLNSMSQC